MILKALVGVMAGSVGSVLGGSFVAGYRRPQPPGLTARARTLDAQLAEALDYEASLKGLHLETLIHIYDALKRTVTGGRAT